MLLLRAGVMMLVALIFLAVLREAALGGQESQVAHISADFSRVRARVNQRFLSVAIDSNLATEDMKFMQLLRSQKLRTLAKALSPAFLRFGGTKQDLMVFSPDEAPLDTPDFPRGGPSAGGSRGFYLTNVKPCSLIGSPSAGSPTVPAEECGNR